MGCHVLARPLLHKSSASNTYQPSTVALSADVGLWKCDVWSGFFYTKRVALETMEGGALTIRAPIFLPQPRPRKDKR